MLMQHCFWNGYLCDTSNKMNQQKRKRKHAKMFPVFCWLLCASFIIAVEKADVTTVFKYEEAAAKGKGIISFLCLRSYGLNCS